MTNLRVRVGLSVPLLILAGCGQPPADVREIPEPLVTSNGHQQNGHQQNGHQQNGPGLQMVGVDLSTMKRLINGAPEGVDPDLSPSNLAPITGVKLVGSMLTNGSIAGTQFMWHVVSGTVTDGKNLYPAMFYIEHISVSPSDPEIYRYQIRSYHPLPPSDGSGCASGNCPSVWDWACDTRTVRIHNSNGTVTTGEIPYLATAVGGQWNFEEGVPGGGRKIIEQGNPDYDTKVTFACETGAIGKCVENMGYKPWDNAPTECKFVCNGTVDGIPRCFRQCTTATRELLHEACVRMIRADYCGDGMSHTVDGVSLDVWDANGIQSETTVSTAPDGYGHEAEWTPNGARCLANVLMTRVSSDVDPSETIEEYLNSHCPGKWSGNTWPDNDCFGFEAGGLTTPDKDTFYYANVPAGFDWHNRALIMNTSECIVDRTRTNSYMTTPPCVLKDL